MDDATKRWLSTYTYEPSNNDDVPVNDEDKKEETCIGKHKKLVALLRKSISEADSLYEYYKAIAGSLVRHIKRIDEEKADLQSKLELEVERSQTWETKCARLEAELELSKKTPCSVCPTLKESIETYVQKNQEAERGLLLVANLLNGESKDDTSTTNSKMSPASSELQNAQGKTIYIERDDNNDNLNDHGDNFDVNSSNKNNDDNNNHDDNNDNNNERNVDHNKTLALIPYTQPDWSKVLGEKVDEEIVTIEDDDDDDQPVERESSNCLKTNDDADCDDQLRTTQNSKANVNNRWHMKKSRNSNNSNNNNNSKLKQTTLAVSGYRRQEISEIADYNGGNNRKLFKSEYVSTANNSKNDYSTNIRNEDNFSYKVQVLDTSGIQFFTSNQKKFHLGNVNDDSREIIRTNSFQNSRQQYKNNSNETVRSRTKYRRVYQLREEDDTERNQRITNRTATDSDETNKSELNSPCRKLLIDLFNLHDKIDSSTVAAITGNCDVENDDDDITDIDTVMRNTRTSSTTANSSKTNLGFPISRKRIHKESSPPPYKYRRDPVRKMNERKKLPGQECRDCYKFYEGMKQDMTDSEYRKTLNKCSRHRDKYPIRTDTPPGFWNPRFDDTDELE